jgi:hypothetical protein
VAVLKNSTRRSFAVIGVGDDKIIKIKDQHHIETHTVLIHVNCNCIGGNAKLEFVHQILKHIPVTQERRFHKLIKYTEFFNTNLAL